MENKKVYDCIVIGGGPAGLTAAIYLKRALHDVLVLEKAVPGGKINYTAIVDNYPGLNHMTGPDLAYQFYDHALALGIELESADVLEVEKKDNIFALKCEDETFYSKTVIVASGTRERKLNVEGEEKFYGRGVSYCAICDGALYRNKRYCSNWWRKCGF